MTDLVISLSHTAVVQYTVLLFTKLSIVVHGHANHCLSHTAVVQYSALLFTKLSTLVFGVKLSNYNYCVVGNILLSPVRSGLNLGPDLM